MTPRSAPLNVGTWDPSRLYSHKQNCQYEDNAFYGRDFSNARRHRNLLGGSGSPFAGQLLFNLDKSSLTGIECLHFALPDA